MRALFDTNVLASAITSPRGASRALLEYALRGTIELVTSPTLMDELDGCLTGVFKFEPAAATAVRVALES
ncbi:MAG: PIN domain-containing protein, partial [Chloroflexota bacterium]